MSDDRCELLCIDLEHAEGLRATLPETDTLQARAERLRALGEPTRLRIVYALHAGAELSCVIWPGSSVRHKAWCPITCVSYARPDW